MAPKRAEAKAAAAVAASSGLDTEDGGAWEEDDDDSSSSNVCSNFTCIRHWTGESEFVFQALILFCIYVLAFMVRLFSVLRFESVIHEFDPWFNFRSTKYLVSEGFYEFHNWFDAHTWYPYGRFIGATVYPGLMWTAAAVYYVMNALRMTVNIRNVCVLLAPWMAGNTSIAVYLLTSQVWNASAGILAAAFMSVVPGYISRSVAGSYDNEAVAIFALVFTFYLWVKAVRTGSMLWAAASAIAYFYMVAAWGGYIFIINLIPAHAAVLLLSGRYSHRLYVSYCTFYVLGALMSMNIVFVGWAPVSSPEHFASFGVFGLLQLYGGLRWVTTLIPASDLKVVLRWALLALAGVVGVLIFLSVTGNVPFLTGRLYSLLGATTNIAIVKSVSEHQPSPWTTFFFDMHMLIFMSAAGLYFCFESLSDQSIFAILYVLFSSYFASIMVRLVLVLSPICCVLGGIACHVTLQTYMSVLASPVNWSLDSGADPSASSPAKRSSAKRLANPLGTAEDHAAAASIPSAPRSVVAREPAVSKLVAFAVVAGLMVLFGFYVVHCTWVTSTAYSSPSIVLQARGHDGGRVIFDDFREAYAWLRHNTAPDARIASWWDYGYQITGMGNRTTIVDNNTRNNTHIATIGLIMASTEERAYPVVRMLDIDYMLVVFGGMIGYSSDDINKFLWMVRISGGVYPEVVERDFFSSQGQYRVDATASKRMTQSMMYKMCYHRFGELQTVYGRGGGFDRVRYAEIGEKNVNFQYFEEAFTSEHWMVRIYRVKTEKTHPNFLERLAYKSS